MVGEQIKKFRKLKGYTLKELGKMVGKSDSTISRLETKKAALTDLELLGRIADALGVSIADFVEPNAIHYEEDVDIGHFQPGEVFEIVKEEEEAYVTPSIPEGAILKLRVLMPNEKLQAGAYYWIEFDDQRKFRMAVDDRENGLGFLPHSNTELRISFDREYVKILGKLITMTVMYEDTIAYE